MAWRSQEQHFHFKNKIKTEDIPTGKKEGGSVYGPDDNIPEGLPDEFYAAKDIYDARGKLIAKKGEVVLSQVKGEEAKRYMACLGIPFPEMGVSKMVDNDPVTEEIRQAYGIRR